MAIRTGCYCANELYTKDPSKALLDVDKIVKHDLEDPKYLERQKQAVASFASDKFKYKYPNYSKEI
jgi:hypothetical protein